MAPSVILDLFETYSDEEYLQLVSVTLQYLVAIDEVLSSFNNMKV